MVQVQMLYHLGFASFILIHTCSICHTNRMLLCMLWFWECKPTSLSENCTPPPKMPKRLGNATSLWDSRRSNQPQRQKRNSNQVDRDGSIDSCWKIRKSTWQHSSNHFTRLAYLGSQNLPKPWFPANFPINKFGTAPCSTQCNTIKHILYSIDMSYRTLWRIWI